MLWITCAGSSSGRQHGHRTKGQAVWDWKQWLEAGGQFWSPLDSPQEALWGQAGLNILGLLSGAARLQQALMLLLRQETIFSKPLAPKPQELL